MEKNVIDQVNHQIASHLDAELYEMLKIHGLYFKGKSAEEMKNELKKNGYEIIVERTGDLTETKYVYKLCKVVEIRKFKIKVDLNAD